MPKTKTKAPPSPEKPKKAKRMGPTVRRELQHKAAGLRGQLAVYEAEKQRHADAIEQRERMVQETARDRGLREREIQRIDDEIKSIKISLGRVEGKLGNGNGNGKK